MSLMGNMGFNLGSLTDKYLNNEPLIDPTELGLNGLASILAASQGPSVAPMGPTPYGAPPVASTGPTEANPWQPRDYSQMTLRDVPKEYVNASTWGGIANALGNMQTEATDSPWGIIADLAGGFVQGRRAGLSGYIQQQKELEDERRRALLEESSMKQREMYMKQMEESMEARRAAIAEEEAGYNNRLSALGEIAPTMPEATRAATAKDPVAFRDAMEKYRVANERNVSLEEARVLGSEHKVPKPIMDIAMASDNPKSIVTTWIANSVTDDIRNRQAQALGSRELFEELNLARAKAAARGIQLPGDGQYDPKVEAGLLNDAISRFDKTAGRDTMDLAGINDKIIVDRKKTGDFLSSFQTDYLTEVYLDPVTGERKRVIEGLDQLGFNPSRLSPEVVDDPTLWAREIDKLKQRAKDQGNASLLAVINSFPYPESPRLLEKANEQFMRSVGRQGGGGGLSGFGVNPNDDSTKGEPSDKELEERRIAKMLLDSGLAPGLARAELGEDFSEEQAKEWIRSKGGNLATTENVVAAMPGNAAARQPTQGGGPWGIGGVPATDIAAAGGRALGSAAKAVGGALAAIPQGIDSAVVEAARSGGPWAGAAQALIPPPPPQLVEAVASSGVQGEQEQDLLKVASWLYRQNPNQPLEQLIEQAMAELGNF